MQKSIKQKTKYKSQFSEIAGKIEILLRIRLRKKRDIADTAVIFKIREYYEQHYADELGNGWQFPGKI